MSQVVPMFYVSWNNTATDSEAPVLESTTSLSLLPGPLWLVVAFPVKIPSIGQIDLYVNYL